MSVCNVATVRSVEQEAFKTRPSFEVMVEAATQVAHACSDLPDPLVFVAGKGNNGGDACVAAALLRMARREVRLVRPLGPPVAGGDAQQAEKIYGDVVRAEEGELDLAGCGAIVDGLFGIGLDRDLDSAAASCVERINTAGKPVLAIDVPSGLDSDHGVVRGVAVRASRTVTFFCNKPGLLMRAGRDHAGEIVVAGLGCGHLVEGQGGEVIDGPVGTDSLRRASDSHKGSHGTLVVIGGSKGMLGALFLATRSAIAHGSGKVFAVEVGGSETKVDERFPEIMWRGDVPNLMTALAIGVGLGDAPGTKELLKSAIEMPKPLLIDADGLNMLAANRRMLSSLGSRKEETVLTPHPAEAARLMSSSTDEVQADRVRSALKLSKKAKSVVALKGSGTVVAGPDGRWGIVDSGNPGLAQAGSGDVLTGIVASLLCQGVPAWEAAASGSWLLGAGADIVRELVGGDVGLPLDEIARASSSLLANCLSE